MHILTKREIASRYRQSIRTIDNWTRLFLPSIKVGGKVLYDADDCDTAVKAFTRRPRLSAKLAEAFNPTEGGGE
jgi:hypothetical protein